VRGVVVGGEMKDGVLCAVSETWFADLRGDLDGGRGSETSGEIDGGAFFRTMRRRAG
jgi:hypothetical protein